MTSSPDNCRAPIFALTADDPLLMAFSSLAEAESYAEPWDVNDGLWTFWDSSGCLLRPPARVDEKKGSTRLASSGEVDTERFRATLIAALNLPEGGDGEHSGMTTHALADLAAGHLNGTGAQPSGMDSERDPRRDSGWPPTAREWKFLVFSILLMAAGLALLFLMVLGTAV